MYGSDDDNVYCFGFDVSFALRISPLWRVRLRMNRINKLWKGSGNDYGTLFEFSRAGLIFGFIGVKNLCSVLFFTFQVLIFTFG